MTRPSKQPCTYASPQLSKTRRTTSARSPQSSLSCDSLIEFCIEAEVKMAEMGSSSHRGVTRTHSLIPEGSRCRVLGDESPEGTLWTDSTKSAEPGIPKLHPEPGYHVKVLRDRGNDIEVEVKGLSYEAYIVPKSFIVSGSISYPSSYLKKQAKAACTIQRVFRGQQGRRQAKCIRHNRDVAAVRIQSVFRMHYHKSDFAGARLLRNLSRKAFSNLP